jgi:O-antigen ligase
MALRSAHLTGQQTGLAILVIVIGLLGALVLASGTLLHAAVLAAILAAPFVIYLASLRPLLLPFGLYIVLVPFDNLLSTGTFGTVTKILGIVAGVLVLFSVLRRHDAVPVQRPLTFLFALFAWMLASSFWALDQTVALTIIPTYAALILLYTALSMSRISAKHFRILLFLTAIGGLISAAYGAYMFYHDPTLAAGADYNGARLVLKSASNYIDPNHFGNALLLPGAIVLMWTLRSPRLDLKFCGACGTALIATAIGFSGSREAFIGFGLIFLYFLIRTPYRIQLTLGAVTLLTVALSAQTTLWTRLANLLNDNGSGRMSIWSVGYEAAKHHFVQGYGIGNFQQAYDIFYLGVHQRMPYGWDSPAHNLVLHYIVETGVIGFALIAVFMWFQFRQLRVIHRTNDLYDYRIALEAAFLAIVAVSLTIDLFTYKYAWLVFSMIALLHNTVPVGYKASAEIRPASSAIAAARSARF